MPKSKDIFPCETGTASWNGEDASFTVTINTTEEFDTNDADALLNKQRLDATLRITPKDGEDPKQKKLLDDGHAQVRIEIDVTGFRRSGTNIMFPAKIPKEKLNGYHSDDFGARTGILTVHGHVPIPEKVKVTSKPANGQATFEDHPDTGPMPHKLPEEQAVEAPAEPPARKRSAKADKEPPQDMELLKAFGLGCEAALAYPKLKIECPKDMPEECRTQWQRGYDQTRAE